MYSNLNACTSAACAYLKTQYTCGSGPYEQLMKDHCKTTCEFCGK